MEHKPIVEKLLAHYKDVHNRVVGIEDYDKIIEFLFKINTEQGVCAYIKRVYLFKPMEWTEKYGYTWGKFPMFADDKSEVLRCLQIRIDNLTKELELINAKTADNG